MPVRGAKTAPTFDGEPRNLLRYFEDLEDLCAAAGITTEEEKIWYALKYLTVEQEELWKTADGATGRVYLVFKRGVKALYPGADGDKRYTAADLDRIAQLARDKGVRTRGEEATYYREYSPVAAFLISKSKIAARHRDEVYMRGFGEEELRTITRRAEIAEPDHDPDDPWGMDVMHKVAQKCLPGVGGGAVGGGGRDTAGTSGTTAPPAATAVVKTEGVDLALFNQTIQMMQAFLAGRSGGAGGALRTGGGVAQGAGGAPGNFLCNFCGDPEHFMRNCGIILQYILDRKIYWDETGKVRLPNSMFVPRGLPGEYMKDRVDSSPTYVYLMYQTVDKPPDLLCTR